MKGRCTFFVFNEVTSFCTSCFKIFLTRDFLFSFVKISIRENCVRNGFIKARGDEAVSSDSDYVHYDTFSEMEKEGMEEIPKEILNANDSFNVESDEEFLGFE